MKLHLLFTNKDTGLFQFDKEQELMNRWQSKFFYKTTRSKYTVYVLLKAVYLLYFKITLKVFKKLVIEERNVNWIEEFSTRFLLNDNNIFSAAKKIPTDAQLLFGENKLSNLIKKANVTKEKLILGLVTQLGPLMPDLHIPKWNGRIEVLKFVSLQIFQMIQYQLII